MKTKFTTVRFIFATAVLGALTSCAHAGSGPQQETRAKPITTIKEAAGLKSGDTVKMVCGACKTVDLVDAVYGRSPSSEIDQYGYEWLKVGHTHKCDHCGGEITVVNGKTTDSMQFNCSKCGEGAASCCAINGDDVPAGK